MVSDCLQYAVHFYQCFFKVSIDDGLVRSDTQLILLLLCLHSLFFHFFCCRRDHGGEYDDLDLTELHEKKCVSLWGNQVVIREACIKDPVKIQTTALCALKLFHMHSISLVEQQTQILLTPIHLYIWYAIMSRLHGALVHTENEWSANLHTYTAGL